MMDSYFATLFSTAIGLTEPWFVKSIDMVKDDKRNALNMEIQVDFREGAIFDYGDEKDCPVYDTHIRRWRHLNFFQYRCFITARVPRVKTQNGVKTIDVPWGREGSGFTLMMEGIILTLIKHMAVATAAKEIGEHDTKIWRVLEYHVKEALKGQDFSDVTGIGVDEYSHKGHNYITVFLSHPDEGKKARVLFVTEGKDKEAVTRFVERFNEKGGVKEEVRVATSDMVHGFRNAMKGAFPSAVITVDKFHVVKNCEDALDKVRRRECSSKDKKKAEVLSGTKYVWLKNVDNLTEHQKAQLDELLQLEYLDTVKAYDLRLRLQEFYNTSCDYDEKTIDKFEHLALEFSNSVIKELQSFGKLLTRNAVEILNYFETRKTNAILEGFNSKISLIKNRARGFRNMGNFMNMIYFCCGELSVPFLPIM